MAQKWKQQPGKAYLVGWFRSIPLKPLRARVVLDSNNEPLAYINPRYRLIKDGQEVDSPTVTVKRRSRPKPGYTCGNL